MEGYEGPRGYEGFPGESGLEGPRGYQGLEGYQGIEGSNGPQGLEGPQGPQGFEGFQGNQGPQGIMISFQSPVDIEFQLSSGYATVSCNTFLSINTYPFFLISSYYATSNLSNVIRITSIYPSMNFSSNTWFINMGIQGTTDYAIDPSLAPGYRVEFYTAQ